MLFENKTSGISKMKNRTRSLTFTVLKSDVGNIKIGVSYDFPCKDAEVDKVVEEILRAVEALSLK
jgi:hypothetical protein